MKKSTIIATCLLNSKIAQSMNSAEQMVRSTFAREFPERNFNDWNKNIDDRAGEQIIKSVGKASMINLKNFILDLW